MTHAPALTKHGAQFFDMVGISETGGLSGGVSVESIHSVLSLLKVRNLET